nr:four helix bundle protein [Robertkochia solimangrovi]
MNVIKDLSFEFAIEILHYYQILQKKHHEFLLSKQIFRSGTAIGTLYREAEYAESKADFIHKSAIAKRNAMKPYIGLRFWKKHPLLIT